MRARNCVGDPARTEPVPMLAGDGRYLLPPDLALPVCPMRALGDPAVLTYLALEGRCRAYRTLPRPGGLLAQRATDLEAFDAIRHGRDATRAHLMALAQAGKA